IEAAAVGAEDAAGDRLHAEDVVDFGVDVIDAGAEAGNFLLHFGGVEELDVDAVSLPLRAVLFRALEIFFVLAEEVAALIESDREAELLAKILETLDRIRRELHVDRRRPDVAEAAGGECRRSLRQRVFALDYQNAPLVAN